MSRFFEQLDNALSESMYNNSNECFPETQNPIIDLQNATNQVNIVT
jgi:hypothetical protein